MTNLITQDGPRALQLADDELIPVLQSSLYPGAKPESIKLVLGYCKAAGLDPMRKPVHIVPMSVKKPGTKNDYEWRDVVMPGIGLYRTDAARTGDLAGVDEPVFGPDVQVAGMTVPEWCSVTVYRMIGGQRVAFTAREYWIENYATAARDSTAPNAMWKRRPRGQIAKCAEAQALRKAFPEHVGSQPTADETIIDVAEVIDNGQNVPAQAEGFKVTRKSKAAAAAPAAAPAATQAEDVTDVEPRTTDAPPAQEEQGQAAAPAPTQSTGDTPLIGAGEAAYLRNKAKAVGADLDKLLADMGGLVLDKLTKADFGVVKSKLMALE